MAHSRRRRLGTIAVALFASAALLAGCSSSGDSGSGGEATDSGGSSGGITKAGVIGDQPEPGQPVSGGTLNFAGFSMPSSLDPTKTQPAGSTGGTEMANIYDLLVRYDAEKQQYVPQLAESLTESDDHLTWTIGLRDGVTFSDGTPLDAQAVVDSMNRFTKNRGANSQQFQAGVKSIEATDPQTVTVTLNAPWSEFPAILTFGYGMILAPAAYADPNNFKPIGAGPYTVADFAPASSLELAPREDYWDGKPYLDTLKFVNIAGGQPRIQAMDSGGVQMTFLRSPEWVKAAEAKYPGFYEPLNVADVLQINNREGYPGADPNIRKAIALALDPDVINQRAFSGDGHPTTKIFAEWSKWHNDVPAFTQDTAQATQLVDAAKANGFDGNLTYVSVNNPSSQAIATSTQAMLNAVGFNVDVQYTATITDMVKRLYVDHDFGITYSSYSISDAVPFMRLDSALRSNSSNNILGYNSPEMDSLLDTAQHATTDDAEKAALQAIEQKIHDDVPFVSLGWGANFVAWKPNVYGAMPSNDGIMLLGNTWIQQ
ncbi:ABC transporter substrate-binding protein [Tomitella fengzijianii]|uniref:ABC transporter substrate-binding protein n=1 Tax=Tomitella fengzijianii TaxID=2597660 RepID=UPI00131C99EA|nr:ABC transporter substrate-binding protein [Tomitella fengzijianii]